MTNKKKYLNEIVRDLLRKQYPAGSGMKLLAEKSGVSERMLYYVRSGDVDDPGASYCHKIYEALTDTQLVA